ncbi:MAG TPA: hypothetical protein VF814_01315 [Casimicrobiaceae bacterium]
MRLGIWALALLALTAVPAAHAAEPDSATLLQEIKALKEAMQDLVQTVRDLERRLTVLEGRAPATTSVPLAKPSAVQAAPPAAPAAAAVPTVTPVMPLAATPVPQAAPAPPPATASPPPVAVPQAAPAAAPQATPAVPQAAPIGVSTEPVSPEAVLRVNWSKIKTDMDESEVARLLGPPSKKFTLDGRTVWYYYYPATGSGSVFFTDAGRVTSRKSPFGWWDW